MPGISIHVVDVSRGIIARGMGIELHKQAPDSYERILNGRIGPGGLLVDDRLSQTFEIGRYRAVFHVGAYYRDAGIDIGTTPFLEAVNYDFGIAVPEQHIHLPFKCTPWGYSCFRGGE